MAKIDLSLQIDKGCVLIVEAGHSLLCNDVTICKGMLIYHRYQKAKKEYNSFFYLFATAALDLSIQICEEPIKTEDVIRMFKSLGPKVREEDPEQDLSFEDKFMELQYDIYRVVFDRQYREATRKAAIDELYCETAHKYVFPYLKLLAAIPDLHKNLISVQTWTVRLLFTFYHCQRCTCYEALEIALAALRLAFLHYRIEAKQLNIITKEIRSCLDEARVLNAMDDILMASDIGTEHINYSLSE